MKFKTIFKFRSLLFLSLILGVSFFKSVNYDSIPDFFLKYVFHSWETFFDFLVDVFTIHYSLIGGIYTMRWWYHERKFENLVFLEVTTPKLDAKVDYDKKQEKDFKEKINVMTQFYRALSEISDMNLWNMIRATLWDFQKISIELLMQNKELKFIVVVDEYYKSIIEKQVTSFFPSANIESVEPYNIKNDNFVNGYYIYTQKDDWYPITTAQEMENDPLNDLANTFSKLEEDEQAVMQMIINPIDDDDWRGEAEKKAEMYFKREKEFFFPVLSNIPIIKTIIELIFSFILPGSANGLSTNAPGASSGDSYIRMVQTKEELAKRMGKKSSQSGFETTIRVLASAKTRARTEEILNNIVVGLTVFKDSMSNWFENRRILPIDSINSILIHHGFKRRIGKFYMGKSSIMTPDELSTILHFPDGKYNPVSVIKWLKYKVLAPPVNVPKTGLLLGYNDFRGEKREIFMKKKDRSRHQYVVGKSGAGKSAFLSFLARQDVKQNEGMCLIDPHGDLVEDVLAFTPKERVKDVVVFDPADTERPMGLNLLEAKNSEQKDRASLDAMNIFIKLFGNEIFGPRIQHYFRNGCLTLMDDEEEGATLIDLPRLFVDDDFQKAKVEKCKNTVVRQFWENEMAKTGQREKEEMIPYFSSKFGPFITNTTMRNIIGQPKSAFNIREIMDEGKILLVNLSKGKIGDLNAQLLGLIFVNKISMAAMSRADIPENQRRDFYLYVDEFQNFATDAFADILSEARKYHLALIMAHQYIAQLNNTQGYEKQSKLKDAVFGNVGTMMSFKVGAEDAEYFEKEYAPDLSQQDILSIANFKAYIKLNIDNATSRPFSLSTIWDESSKNLKVAEIIKKYSRLKHGRKKEFVDQEIESRLGI